MMRFAAKREKESLFVRQPSEETEEIPSLPPQTPGAGGTYRVTNKEAGWSGAWQAWGYGER